MLKLAAVFFLGSMTTFVAAPRLVYSGLQFQVPLGTAIKMAPDPSNIWSFHETVTVPAGRTVQVPVVIDFDNNGKMDTELKGARLVVTDMQALGATQRSNAYAPPRVRLVDDQGVRWAFGPSLRQFAQRRSDVSLSTPLALAIDSSLRVEIINPDPGGQLSVTINLIGRLVTM